jgi:hypothetical protein
MHNENPSHDDFMRMVMQRWPSVRFVSLESVNAWTHPSEYNRTKKFKDGFTLGYRKMCDFWATKIQQVAIKFDLDWYMRLDLDSFLACEVSLVPFRGKLKLLPRVASWIGTQSDNLFEAMRTGNFTYGYFSHERDAASVSKGYNRFVKQYVLDHGLNLNGTIAGQLPIAKESDRSGSLSFYNNFEIVKVSHLLRADVLNFTRAVSQSHGIYDWRWGDAIIRFYQVALFLRKQDVHCFTYISSKHFYEHQGKHFFESKEHKMSRSIVGPVNRNRTPECPPITRNVRR